MLMRYCGEDRAHLKNGDVRHVMGHENGHGITVLACDQRDLEKVREFAIVTYMGVGWNCRFRHDWQEVDGC